MKEEVKWKERHKRPDKLDVDILDYKPLLVKVLHQLLVRHGQYVMEYEEELMQEGYIALMSAWESYDPTKGTFVTIAYLRCRTLMGRELARNVKHFKRTNQLEDLNSKSSDRNSPGSAWCDTLPSNEIDYRAISCLAIPEYDDVGRRMLRGLCDGVRPQHIHAHLNITLQEAKDKYKEIKDNMVAVTNELYEGESLYYLGE